MLWHTDIAYSGEHVCERRMDALRPDAATAKGSAILFIHGGAWVSGKRGKWHSVMEHFAQRGYVCATVDYRSAPRWRFPAQYEDVRLGLAYLRRQGAAWGFDSGRVAVVGSSAGAHLAGLLATPAVAEQLAEAEPGGCDTRPAAAVLLCAVLSLRGYPVGHPLIRTIERLMGGSGSERADQYRRASPLERVSGKEPPILMVVGDQDQTTGVESHRRMQEKLRAAGASAELLVLEGVGHGFGYGTTTAAQKQTLLHMESFFARTL